MFRAPRSPYMNLAFEQPFRQTGTSTSCGTITVTEESSGGGGGETPPGDGGGGGETPPDNGGSGGDPGGPGARPGDGSDQIIPVIDDTLAFVGGGAVLLVIILLLLVTQT
jgi:hypothetical protein